MSTTRPVGTLLREWRQRRRLSQLGFATEAGISPKHLSFIETGRARPSREMLLHLAEELDIPLRERNALLVAAGFAPMYTERSLDDPALHAAREAVDLVLQGHEPYPALAVDRHWTMVAANAGVHRLLNGLDPAMLQPPVNVLRLSLHPGGLAPRIVNFGEWRAHLLARLRKQIAISGDPELIRLFEEFAAFPAPQDAPRPEVTHHAIVVPLQLRTSTGVMSLISTTTVFGTPIDVTLAELAIESFFPADAATAEMLRG